MAKEEGIELEGRIKKVNAGLVFIVELENGHEITAYPSGKMRKFYIKMMEGDRVKVEVSPYDLTKGRITYRHKK